jgi:threonine synthase
LCRWLPAGQQFVPLASSRQFSIMDYYSTNHRSPGATFREAVLSGLAPDGGLWMPSDFPRIKSVQSFAEIALEFSKIFANGEIPDEALDRIVRDTFNFDVPLVRLADGLYVLELFHGPTLSFKDFGARFLARLLSFFLTGSSMKMTVLTATSGDTGSAVASGFSGVPNVSVFLVYPSGKVSLIQEKQMTTWDGNITAIEVEGNFDDCQQMVKQAFRDLELKQLNLTSANSINIGRLIPQCFYYAYGAAQLAPTCFVSVPCGNLGNLTAGIFARKMGATIEKFIAATNTNDGFVRYLKTGIFDPQPGHATISNAMDVGNPSNLARIAAFYSADPSAMNANILGFSFDDAQTLNAIRELYEKYGYLCDPHTAVAFLGLQKSGLQAPGIFIATAHPAKFPEIVREACDVNVDVPEELRTCMDQEKQSIRISNDYLELKKLLQ